MVTAANFGEICRLIDSGLSSAAIARQLGRTPSVFARAFKSYTGASVKAWRGLPLRSREIALSNFGRDRPGTR